MTSITRASLQTKFQTKIKTDLSQVQEVSVQAENCIPNAKRETMLYNINSHKPLRRSWKLPNWMPYSVIWLKHHQVAAWPREACFTQQTHDMCARAIWTHRVDPFGALTAWKAVTLSNDNVLTGACSRQQNLLWFEARGLFSCKDQQLHRISSQKK